MNRRCDGTSTIEVAMVAMVEVVDCICWSAVLSDLLIRTSTCTAYLVSIKATNEPFFRHRDAALGDILKPTQKKYDNDCVSILKAGIDISFPDCILRNCNFIAWALYDSNHIRAHP
jgi:hypothetical protein